ncbi:MAG: alpha/beta hydrolase [Pirellula sp.]|nr:alpha/beta hydrolase [Pirellula sp.]
MKKVTIGDRQCSVYDKGSGATILFVHGFPLSHAMWRGQLETLKARFRVVAPDLRGFGGSPLPAGVEADEKSTMRQMADDCAVVLDALQIAGPVVLCGLSMGGYVAWQFAKHHSGKLRGLILCDTKAAGDTPEAAETRRKMAEHVLKHGTSAVAEAMPAKLFAQVTHKEQQEIVAEVRKTIEATSPQGLAAAQRGMAEREDVRSWLPNIAVPTLVIVGREDAISPVDEMRAIADAIPGAKFHVVEQAGHMAPLEQPGDVNTLIADFVGSLA